MEINYSGKSALIVDSKLDDLGVLRQILSRLGIEQVQVASSVNMALSLMREFAYDFCFAAYDMGKDEKNGLQLLHEANSEASLSSSSAFFLIVDPSASELLFGSLENSPDTYISKPFDQAKVRFRVEKQLRIKQAIKPVEELLANGDYEELFEHSEKLIEHYPGLGIFLQRINGIALLRMGRFSQAKELFIRLTQKRDLPWAEVGRGMAAYNLGEYEEALEALNKVVDQQHICAEAYTWLSRVYRAKGELERAVSLMRKAVMLQPTVPVLQGELGDVAAQTGEWDIARDAFQQGVRYGRYSAYQTPDNYIGLAHAFMLANKSAMTKIENDVIRVLEDVVLDHPDDQETMFRAKLSHCEYYRQAEMPERLEQMINQCWAFFRNMPREYQCQWLDIMLDTAQQSAFETQVQAYRKELSRDIVEQDWGKASYSAMSAFRNGDLDRAFQLFGRANELLPEHIGIALNLIQSGIEKAKRGENARWILLSVQDVLMRMRFGALPFKQQARYLALAERFSEQSQRVQQQTLQQTKDDVLS